MVIEIFIPNDLNNIKMISKVDPTYWFLPHIPNIAQPYTSNNKVEALIDGQAYMQHLNYNIVRMISSDYFHLCGWQVTSGQKLLGATSNSPTFVDQLKNLVLSGATVRALLWMWNVPDNPVFATEINQLNRPNGIAVLDTRLLRLSPTIPSPSSHHQKSVVLSSDGEHWAYVGGIDIGFDRWDTNNHNGSPDRTKYFFDAWHDVHCVIRGFAVSQIWNNFRQRWNDPTRPNVFQNVPPPIPASSTPVITFNNGTHHVQVLRTLVCKLTYPFMPTGEQTVRLAYEKAIDSAEHYIYIEDQYLWPCSIIDKLRDAASRGVKIILVVAHEYDVPFLKPWHNQMRLESLERIAAIRPENLYTYHLEQSQPPHSDIYVHAKVMVVDDRYAAIGSANINNRSSTNDSELHVAIIDANTVQGPMDGTNRTVCIFAKDLRLKLWQEHLGVNANVLDDPILALTTIWPDCSTSTPSFPNRKHHVVCHHVPEPRFNWDTWPISIRKDVMDPKIICP
jgi:phosphatidylserine/phosphatidylglycerophosphate/cardiolipin synthase-like enzyme